jgi:voltage-gated potassium channel
MESRQRWQATVTFVLIVLTTVCYYLLPVPGRMREGSWAVLFGCGVAVLGMLIVLSIRRLLRAGAETRVRALILLLCVTVFFFSWVDVTLAEIPGQFVSLHTKTDGLYFSVSTLATVGFGDVHAIGQLARTSVTLQIVFNLVFLGGAVATITGLFKVRAGLQPRPAPHEPGRSRSPRRDSGGEAAD